MGSNRRHQPLFAFVRRILDVAATHSVEDLVAFRNEASKSFPVVLPLTDEYIRLAKTGATDVRADADFDDASRVIPRGMGMGWRPPRDRPGEMHLFDLLRDKRLFVSNADLADFARRILPNIKANRFDKMSRGDIAARIIEHLEAKDQRTRRELEASMRDVISSPKVKPSERKSFVSKWERIIKGIEF